MSETTLSEDGAPFDQDRRGSTRLGLMIAWSAAEPGRVGEIALVPSRPSVLGRGGPQPEDGGERLSFQRLRPGQAAAGAPLGGKGLSRQQLTLRAEGDRLRVKNTGKVALWHEGKRADEAAVEVGDRLYLERQMLLLCVERASDLAVRGAAPPFAFGEADAHGLVGESAAAYRLRDQVGFSARREGHALIQGPSGAGKELCARAIHALSSRKQRPFVARNAATIPSGIVDAELFGNAKNYPNAGMRERQGLVGAADGGTLFLDEIGELPEELQAHLLRLLDGGEYHRLGDDRTMKADLRLVGATNRDLSSIKHDLLARFPLRVVVPGLDERREDIPLIARVILRRIAAKDDEIASRFADAAGEIRVDPALVEALLGHDFTTHVREIEQILMLSMSTSQGDHLALTDEARALLKPRGPSRAALSPEEIRACLARVNGNVSVAWKELGLSSRDALRRLIRKHNIEVERPRDERG